MGAAKKFKTKVRELVNAELDQFFKAMEANGKEIWNKFEGPKAAVIEFAECLEESMKVRSESNEDETNKQSNESSIKRKFRIEYYEQGGELDEIGKQGIFEYPSINHARKLFKREHPNCDVIEIIEVTTADDIARQENEDDMEEVENGVNSN